MSHACEFSILAYSRSSRDVQGDDLTGDLKLASTRAKQRWRIVDTVERRLDVLGRGAQERRGRDERNGPQHGVVGERGAADVRIFAGEEKVFLFKCVLLRIASECGANVERTWRGFGRCLETGPGEGWETHKQRKRLALCWFSTCCRYIECI